MSLENRLKGQVGKKDHDIYLTQCAKCKQYKTFDGWVDIDCNNYLNTILKEFKISHGYCPTCKNESLKKFDYETVEKNIDRMIAEENDKAV